MAGVISVCNKSEQSVADNVTVCTTVKQAAKRILGYTDEQVTVLCIGDPAFTFDIGQAVLDALNRLT